MIFMARITLSSHFLFIIKTYFVIFFPSIYWDVHLNTPLNVIWITVKQWNQLLLERGTTHTCDDPDSPPVLIRSRLEESNPGTDFSHSYRLTRMFGLAPEQKSFLFKTTQNLLPTKERLHRSGKTPSPSCIFCNAPQDTLEHLLTCPHSTEVTTPLLACLASQVDNLTPQNIIHLNIHTPESWELPAVWLVSTCLMFVWEERMVWRRSRLDICQADCSPQKH